MHVLADTLTLQTAIFLAIALALALVFQFVNGFHDTANAVATVIYTNTLPPWLAVIWSGLWNLIGVLMATGAVAFSVLSLLPADLVANIGSSAGFAMVFAVLISAIFWNVGTWYLGLPASSSHTLIGSIMGVGLANSLIASGHVFGKGVNWSQAEAVFATLLVSPIVGFVGAGLLLLICKAFIRNPSLYASPNKKAPPPKGIRALLVLTCTGVSYAHGSNDGQKGMGLILLILVGILPETYALNMGTNSAELKRLQASATSVAVQLRSRADDSDVTPSEAGGILSDYVDGATAENGRVYGAFAEVNYELASDLDGRQSLNDFPQDQVKAIRSRIYLLSNAIAHLQARKPADNPIDAKTLADYRKELTATTQYIPRWVKVAVALALGLGTMFGWKRIVVTIGERIGKRHLTYAQGAAAELVTMATIGAADLFGLPVSTTHVLSSGVAGTMAANRSGLQVKTVRNIILAWVLTLPVCMILGGAIFSATLLIIFTRPIEKFLILAGILGLAAVVVWVCRELKPKRVAQPEPVLASEFESEPEPEAELEPEPELETSSVQ